MEKAGIDPAAAAPSQPDRLNGSHSDHSAKRIGFVAGRCRRRRERERYSQTCELRPPKGLGISGPISQVVSLARLGSKIFNIESYTCPRASRRHQ